MPPERSTILPALPSSPARIGQSMGVMFILRLLSQGVTFVTLIVLAKSLGPTLYGQYAFILGYLVFFTLVVSFGINEIIVREIAAQERDRDTILRSGIFLKCILSLVAVILAILGLFLIELPEGLHFWGIVASVTLLTSFTFHSCRTILEVPFQADFRMEGPSLIVLVVRIIFLSILILFMSAGISLGVAISAQLLSEIAGVILLIYFARRRGYPIRPLWNANYSKYILAQGWPIAISGVFVMIYTKIDILLLQALRSSTDVGYYAVSMRLVDALAIVPTVFMMAALPVFSHTYYNDTENFIIWVRVSFRLLLLVILPITAVTTFYAFDIIHLFYGSAYASSAAALGILIWAEIFVYGGLVFDGALVASSRQRIGTLLAGGMALCNVILNLWSIPRYGIIGAAWTTAVSYALGLIISVFIPRIRDVGKAFWKELLLPVAIAVILGGIAKWFNLQLWKACLWECVGFYLGMFLIGTLKLADLKRAKHLMFRDS